MNRKTLIAILGVVAVIFIGTGVYSVSAKNARGRAASISLTNNTSDAQKADFNALLSTFTFSGNTPNVTVKLQQCPDAWIDNQMPSAGGEKPMTEYYILKGERLEINAFDVPWVAQNCTITKQVVY